MHLGHRDVLRADAGALVGELGRLRGDVPAHVLGLARGTGGHHRGQHTHRAAPVGQARQCRFGADDGGSGAVADRRAHRQRQRVGDRRRGQHLLDGVGIAVLRQRVVRRVGVVLGRDGRELPLRGAELAHVKAPERGVDVHEQAVRCLGGAALGRLDAAAHGQQRRLVGLGVLQVPGTVEDAEHLGLVGAEHLFGADSQSHLHLARTHRLHRQVEGRAGAGAGVLEVVDRDALDAQRAQRDLAAHHGLALQHALRGVGEIGGLDVGDGQAGVGQRGVDGIGGELLDAAVEELAGRRHADAGDVGGRMGCAHGRS